ncbi:LytR C-terminal domain-containing protein [Streptomyces sp. NPDC007088]|uniref:LCP family protein n=1 Tax=Streptomyces sp. NPDC007088 TaxID=3364773 RepID=UPI0036C12A4D
MNDRDNPYPPYDGGDHGADSYEIVGYDEYGRPVYQQVPPPAQSQTGLRDRPPQYGGHEGYQGYEGQGGYEPYATGQQPQVPRQQDSSYGSAYDPYEAGQGGAHSPQGPGGGYDTGYDAYGNPYGTPYGQQVPAQGAPPYGDTSRETPYADGSREAPYGSGPEAPYGRGDDAGAAGARHGDPIAPLSAVSTGGASGTREPETGTAGGAAASASAPARRGRSGSAADTGEEAPDYRTEMFSFIEEPTEQSEDVIDWLKFTESRTERREEARRRGRSRVIALVVALALVVVGGVGYLWYAGKLPGTSSRSGGAADARGPQKRDVIVVHLHNTKKSGTSTMLLVDNTTTKHGTAVLLPNDLALSDEDGSPTTLGKSVADDGSSGTGEALDGLLGTDIQGTWRLDTPYLNNLVELVGSIEVDTDTDVPDTKKGAEPLVHKGRAQSLSGSMAVAYATYRAPGEPESAQLKRFGDVMRGVLRKLSSDPKSATVTVQSLAQILDPSLTDKDLGTFLAKLSELAKGGDYSSKVLPVRDDGSLSESTTEDIVKDVLGGTVKPAPDGASDSIRVGVKNATGDKSAAQKARVALLNGGYTFLDGSTSDTVAASRVVYADAKSKEQAVEVARTLGLPDSAVSQGKVTNGDVSVVLGSDYKPKEG